MFGCDSAFWLLVYLRSCISPPPASVAALSQVVDFGEAGGDFSAPLLRAPSNMVSSAVSTDAEVGVWVGICVCQKLSCCFMSVMNVGDVLCDVCSRSLSVTSVRLGLSISVSWLSARCELLESLECIV